MATTTNFGWETPDDTDLVKDGAAAMRTLGNSIDTSFVDLKGGTTGQILSKASNTDLDYTWITNDVGDITAVTAGTGITGGGTSGAVTITNDMATKIDAKGDLIAGTGADTYDRLAVGANNTVLTADSSTATGLKWATPAGGANFSLLNTGGTALTGATTVTYSGISGKDQLYILIDGASSANASATLRLQLNTDTGTNYTYYGIRLTGDSVYDASIIDRNGTSATTSIPLAQMADVNSSAMSGGVYINGCNASGLKMVQSAASGNPSNTGHRAFIQTGFYSGTSTISSISLVSSTGNFDAGTFYVYGSA